MKNALLGQVYTVESRGIGIIVFQAREREGTRFFSW
jgi:hypothetical protein